MAAWFIPLIAAGISALGSVGAARAGASVGNPEASNTGGGTKYIKTVDPYTAVISDKDSQNLASSLLGESIARPRYGSNFTMPNLLDMQAGFLKNRVDTGNTQVPDSRGGLLK